MAIGNPPPQTTLIVLVILATAGSAKSENPDGALPFRGGGRDLGKIDG